MSSSENQATALQAVKDEIELRCARAGRSINDVTLIAVSKTKPLADVQSLIDLGHRHFGENKVQEAVEKFTPLKEQYHDVRLHLIGPLQTNKVKEAVSLADAIHSVDREKLARSIATQRDKLGRCPDLFVQVNIGEEPQKAGVIPSELPKLLATMGELDLKVQGLMCIPPANDPPAGHFAFLNKLASRHGLPGLSMGMSSDYSSAIELGATHIRVGSALFGARDYPKA